ncbi:hypothetical protein F4604DRAFT_989847 [Suillus subluteus]|nr:hypothetical protein F4604DRAFT_989847 [Suillus subluteus]
MKMDRQEWKIQTAQHGILHAIRRIFFQSLHDSRAVVISAYTGVPLSLPISVGILRVVDPSPSDDASCHSIADDSSESTAMNVCAGCFATLPKKKVPRFVLANGLEAHLFLVVRSGATVTAEMNVVSTASVLPAISTGSHEHCVCWPWKIQV